jgi:hypothetical protein
MALRAMTTFFQLVMARSMGARARVAATEQAMIAPAERSPMMVR